MILSATVNGPESRWVFVKQSAIHPGNLVTRGSISREILDFAVDCPDFLPGLMSLQEPGFRALMILDTVSKFSPEGVHSRSGVYRKVVLMIKKGVRALPYQEVSRASRLASRETE